MLPASAYPLSIFPQLLLPTCDTYRFWLFDVSRPKLRLFPSHPRGAGSVYVQYQEDSLSEMNNIWYVPICVQKCETKKNSGKQKSFLIRGEVLLSLNKFRFSSTWAAAARNGILLLKNYYTYVAPSSAVRTGMKSIIGLPRKYCRYLSKKRTEDRIRETSRHTVKIVWGNCALLEDE